jgi:putrescine importer
MGERSATGEVNSQVTAAPAVPRLRRVLGLWDLVFYGLVLVQPIAAVPLFGVAQDLSLGHTVSTVLVGMVPMLLTAISYGRMAALYPAAGSAYTYVGRAITPHAGFLAGWAMFLGYLVLPLINVIYVAVTIQREFSGISYTVGAAGFAALITLLNLCGIRWTARANQLLLVSMCAVIGVFLALAVRYLFHAQGVGGLFSVEPFYNPQTFHLRTISTATAFAALTYIGFDGLTTLAEDAHNPRRNVLLAIVLVVVLTAVFSGTQVYLAQRVWPQYWPCDHPAAPGPCFPSRDTAFMDVCQRVGGMLLYHSMWVILIVASFGSGLTGQVGAARILFGMGRDGVLPRKLFSYLNPWRSTPVVNIALIGLLSFGFSLLLNRGGRGYELGGELLNSGALIAFMSVNLAAFWQFYVRGHGGRVRSLLTDALMPLFGFASCLAIWFSLPALVMAVAAGWLLAGLVIVALKTRGFRTRPVMIDFSEP